MSGTVVDRTSGIAALVAQSEFRRLKQKIIETSGLQYYADKDQILAERAEQRRITLGCGAIEYCRRILDPAGAGELAKLIDELTVGETYFFRYPEQLEALRQVVIPNCIARRQRKRRLRIWCAGCASGAEPYSLSILLKRDLAEWMWGWETSILGTDICHKAIDQARSGLFSNWELRTASDALRRQCFVEKGREWLLKPEYRRDVEFQYQNLVTEIDAFARDRAGMYDIIFCRNVMIYFGTDLMRHLLRRFSECLADGGWFLVGHAEPYFEIANYFSPTTTAGATLYRKLDAAPVLVEHDPWPAMPGPTEHRAGDTWPEAFLPPSMPWLEPDQPPAGSVADRAAQEAAPTTIPAASDVSKAAPASTAPDTAAGQLETIRRHADAGEWKAAVEACERAMRQHPLLPAVHFAYALVAEHTGATGGAEEAFGRAIYLDRGFVLAHYHLGRCQAARGDRAAAIRSLANALKMLGSRDDKETLDMGDGLTVAELRDLTRLHMGLLEER